MSRFVPHAPDDHDSDPHVFDTERGEVAEALLDDATGRAAEYNAGLGNQAYLVEADAPVPTDDSASASVIADVPAVLGKARLVVHDLTVAAAERDARLRREGWDAALAAVRAEYEDVALLPGEPPSSVIVNPWPVPRRRHTAILDRLASEGPR